MIVDGVFYPASGLHFNKHQVQLACKYFGFSSGELNNFRFQETYIFFNNTLFAFFVIKCEREMWRFQDCKIRYENEIWLNRLPSANMKLTCFADTKGKATSCKNKIKNNKHFFRMPPKYKFIM